MDDPKRSAAALRRISWYLCQGYPSLFFEERPVSFVRGLLISFPYSPSCDLSSQGLLGRVLSAHCDFWESLAVPSIPSHFFCAAMMLLSHWLRHWFFVMMSAAQEQKKWLRHWFFGIENCTLERIRRSSLCGLAVLHYIGLKNIWVDSEVVFCMFLSVVHLTRFHQDLGWLSCLRSPTFRHMYNRGPCFTGHYGQCCFAFLDALCHRCFLLLDRMRLLSPVFRTQWLLCADPPFTCTIDDANPEWISRLWRTLPRIPLLSNLFD